MVLQDVFVQLKLIFRIVYIEKGGELIEDILKK